MLFGALDTGLRLNNLCNLMKPEVIFSEDGKGTIWKSSEAMKNKQYLGVPLTDRACEAIKELLKFPCITGHIFRVKGKPLYDRQVQRALKKVLLKAGITDFHFHDLRHSFASYLSQNGVDLYTISKLLGHKDVRMTKRYAHLNADNLRGAISKLDTPCHNYVTVKKSEITGSL